MLSICPHFKSIYSTPMHKVVFRISSNEYYTYEFCACVEGFKVFEHCYKRRERGMYV